MNNWEFGKIPNQLFVMSPHWSSGALGTRLCFWLSCFNILSPSPAPCGCGLECCPMSQSPGVSVPFGEERLELTHISELGCPSSCEERWGPAPPCCRPQEPQPICLWQPRHLVSAHEALAPLRPCVFCACFCKAAFYSLFSISLEYISRCRFLIICLFPALIPSSPGFLLCSASYNTPHEARGAAQDTDLMAFPPG